MYDDDRWRLHWLHWLQPTLPLLYPLGTRTHRIKPDKKCVAALRQSQRGRAGHHGMDNIREGCCGDLQGGTLMATGILVYY